MSRVWSPYQTAIFEFVRTGQGNAVVEAVAGSGKTTTIVEALSTRRSVALVITFLSMNVEVFNETTD